jgi:hypothetical protein
MSTCISRHGEYSNHAGGDDWSCSRCGIFDVDGVLAALAYTQEQMAQMVPKNWHGLMAILDDIYPESIFPTVPDRKDRGDGARIISLLRYLTEAQQHLAEAHAIDDRLSAELHGGPESTGGPHGWIGRAVEAEEALIEAEKREHRVRMLLKKWKVYSDPYHGMCATDLTEALNGNDES